MAGRGGQVRKWVCYENFSNSRFENEHLRHGGRVSKLLADKVHYGGMQRLFVNANFGIKKLNCIKVVLFVIPVYAAGHYTISLLITV